MTDIETVIAQYMTHNEAYWALNALEQAAKNAVAYMRNIAATSPDTNTAEQIDLIANQLQSVINNVRQQARAACKEYYNPGL